MSILYENDYNVKQLETITGTGEILQDLTNNGKDRQWGRRKISSQKLFDLYTEALEIDNQCITESSYLALNDCASYLLFSLNVENRKKLKVANFCKARLCPMCNWRKSLKLYGQTKQITDVLLTEQPTVRFIFATFTIKNCKAKDLSATLDQMNAAFKRLIDKSKMSGSSKKFKESLLGYMKAIEVTYNQDQNTYHPHIHALFVVKPSYFSGHGYITKQQWQDIWEDLLGIDYNPIVHVQTVKAQKGIIAETVEEKRIALQSAICETAKYPVKETDIESVEPLIVFSNALRNRRLVTFGGIMAKIRRDLKLTDIENGDLIHVEQEDKPSTEVAQILFKWQGSFGAYIC